GAADSFPKGKGFEIYGKVKMGGIYQSEVIEWEDWGLVKTCYAPIYNAQGDVVSVAAADVDVSIISSKTRLALLQTVFIGVAAVLIAGLVAYGITLTLLRPIVALKDKTLVVAAGQYGEKVPLQGPAEIKSLCQAFNTLSTTLDRSFKDKQTSNTTLIHQSVRRRLEEYLDFESPLSLLKSQIVYEGVHFTVRNQAIDLSGCEYSFDRSLLWVASSTGSKMNANRIHQEMKSLARRFMDSRQDWDTFLSILRYLYPESIHGFAFFHKESTAFDYFTHSANAAACLFGQEQQKQWAFDRRLSATLEPGQVMLLGNEPLLNDLQANFPFYPLSQAAQGGIDPILKEWKQAVLQEQVKGSLAEGHILVLVRPKL
ncbi:HAMP domain-containing protein, partial [bacterium]|nr:HAMP domain-containing protein [bacterium]